MIKGGIFMKRGKLPIIITVCVLVIAAIIISCIEFPSSIKADTDVTELSVTRGKDGKKQEIADSSRIISLLDGMKVKKYSLVSKIKGDTLKSGWEYRLSYKAADGSSNSITISHGEVEYKGKRINCNDIEEVMWENYREDRLEERREDTFDGFYIYMKEHQNEVYEILEEIMNREEN